MANGISVNSSFLKNAMLYNPMKNEITINSIDNSLADVYNFKLLVSANNYYKATSSVNY